MVKKLATLLGVSLLVAACTQAEETLQLEQPDTIVDGGSVDLASIEAGSVQDFISNVGDIVYFEYAKSDLTEDTISALSSQVEWLTQYEKYSFTVAGHADERGTREYNLALGEARAAAVQNYFIQNGIADDRIEIVSYGEEQPVVTGSDEYAWSQNRRSQSILR